MNKTVPVEPTEEWHEKMDAVLAQQSRQRHPECLVAGCLNKIHHGHLCRGMCENLEEF